LSVRLGLPGKVRWGADLFLVGVDNKRARKRRQESASSTKPYPCRVTVFVQKASPYPREPLCKRRSEQDPAQSPCRIRLPHLRETPGNREFAPDKHGSIESTRLHRREKHLLSPCDRA